MRKFLQLLLLFMLQGAAGALPDSLKHSSAALVHLKSKLPWLQTAHGCT